MELVSETLEFVRAWNRVLESSFYSPGPLMILELLVKISFRRPNRILGLKLQVELWVVGSTTSGCFSLFTLRLSCPKPLLVVEKPRTTKSSFFPFQRRLSYLLELGAYFFESYLWKVSLETNFNGC